VEEADAADAEGGVTQGAETGDDVADAAEDEGGRGGAEGSLELHGEEARMRTGAEGCGQKTVEEGEGSGEGERAGRLARFPAGRGQAAGEVRRPAPGGAALGHVAAQTVQGDEQDVRPADDLVHVDHTRGPPRRGHGSICRSEGGRCKPGRSIFSA